MWYMLLSEAMLISMVHVIIKDHVDVCGLHCHTRLSCHQWIMLLLRGPALSYWCPWPMLLPRTLMVSMVHVGSRNYVDVLVCIITGVLAKIRGSCCHWQPVEVHYPCFSWQRARKLIWLKKRQLKMRDKEASVITYPLYACLHPPK